MYMDTTKIYADILTNGYSQFSLKDYNAEYYTELLPLKCNETQNLKEIMTSVRIDGAALDGTKYPLGIHTHINGNSFEELCIEKSKILNQMDGKPAQTWYKVQCDGLPIGSTIKKIVRDITKNIFSLDETIKITELVNEITFFDNGSLIVTHKDGLYSDRICTILIYLNEEYDVNNGGILKLDGNVEILPIFGNVAIIGLRPTDLNVEHEVTEVTGGIGRYAICAFMKINLDN